MAILTDNLHRGGLGRTDNAPRAVVTYNIYSDHFDMFELDLHTHIKGQIILIQRGALSCEVEGGLWIVPPASAIWIPGGALHAVKATGELKGYNAFVAPDLGDDLAANCCAVSVTPLLRELLCRSASLPLYYEEEGANAGLMAILQDEIADAGIEYLHIYMPRDERLRRSSMR